jgi:hypothetical protein
MWRKIMNSTTQTKTDFAPFQNLDAISALREISDGAAAICSGGTDYSLTKFKCIIDQDGDSGNDEITLQINGKSVWTNNNVDRGNEFSLESLPNIKGTDTVALWERDKKGNKDDLIGSFRPDDATPPSVALNQNGGRYNVGFKKV